MDLRNAIEGCLLGTAVGDSLGLPREGLSARRAKRLFGPELRQAFFLGRGMLSDDTEQSCMVVQAWLRAEGDASRFGRSLAWRLRWWMAALPAGVGLGTAKAILKLWLGVPWRRSGSGSAGNGAAMRIASLGLLCPPAELAHFVATATEITHRDPRARRAALLVALSARHGAERGPEGLEGAQWMRHVRSELEGDMDEELDGLLNAMETGLAGQHATQQFAESIGVRAGVSGYAYRTVPVALYAWLQTKADLSDCLGAVVALGGDTDTVGAIAGALVGATRGGKHIEGEWLENIRDLPRSIPWIRRLARQAAAGKRPLPLFWPLVLPRNLLFLAIVLGHGLRRLFPPYR